MAPSKAVAVSADTVEAIDPDQTLKASKALLAHMKKASTEKAAKSDKKNLLAADPDDDSAPEVPIWLTLTTKRHIIDSNRLKPGKIVLPHPLNNDPEVTICLISADPQRAYKNLVASEDFPTDLRKKVTRVIDVGKLKSKFKSYEQQRKLYAEHDVFLGDTRIINRLPKILGKTFYKSTTKRPIPVEIQARKPKVDGKRAKPQARKSGGGEDAVNACTPTELADEIQKAVGAALVNLAPSTQTAIRIGYAGWNPEQIAANVNAVAAVLIDKYVPQKWKNLRSIYIKGPETAALPIWLTRELWLEENDVISDEAAAAAKALKSSEKANIGKKRKSVEGDETEEATKTGPVTRRAKKAKSEALAAAGEEDQLDKEIAERKALLKKQSKGASKKKAVSA